MFDYRIPAGRCACGARLYWPNPTTAAMPSTPYHDGFCPLSVPPTCTVTATMQIVNLQPAAGANNTLPSKQWP